MINIHKNNLIFVGPSDTIDLINNSKIVYTTTSKAGERTEGAGARTPAAQTRTS